MLESLSYKNQNKSIYLKQANNPLIVFLIYKHLFNPLEAYYNCFISWEILENLQILFLAIQNATFPEQQKSICLLTHGRRDTD